MQIRLLILCFLLIFGKLKTQTLSTVFIDTLQITVADKIIYESNKTILKFILNNTDCKLTLYNDGFYRFNIKFAHTESKNLNYLSSSGEEFYIKDSICTSKTNSSSDAEFCSETNIYQITLKNWSYNNPNAPDKYNIRLCYRLCRFAPIDTNNYAYKYREGIWIGPDRGVKKVTVNYSNDKKQGLATAYYDNGTTYNVNFNNNIADNYGQGQWKNYKSKFTYSIPNIVTRSCNSIKMYSRESFVFSRGKKTKEIRKYNDLSVYFEKKGVRNDSIEYRVRGDFMDLNNDTITLKASEIEIHDYYKKNSDTLHNFYKKTINGYSKIPLKDISKIYYARDNLKQITLRITLLSILAGAVVSPLISIQKNGFNHERFRNVSLTSLGVMTLSISFGISFSQKEYLIKPNNKNNKTWKIMNDVY